MIKVGRNRKSSGGNLNRLLIKISNNQPSEFPNLFNDAEMTYYMDSTLWKTLEQVESSYGLFFRLNKSGSIIKCAKCGSFSIPCRDLFYALLPTPSTILDFNFNCHNLSDETADILSEWLWGLLNIMIVEKLKTDKEWIAFQDSQMLDLQLLYTANGELLHRDDGYPLGLVFEDVFFKLSVNCVSCSCYIR